MMASIALSEPEREYIREHISDGAGRIAFDLRWKFKEFNGGQRSRRTVRSYIYRLEHSQTLTLRIPTSDIQKARDKGILKEDLIKYGQEAVIKYIRKVDRIRLTRTKSNEF